MVEYKRFAFHSFTVSNFKLNTQKQLHLRSIQSSVTKYMLLKQLHQNNNSKKGMFPSLFQFITCTNYNNLDTEKSHVEYLDLISLRADNKDNILVVLDRLHKMFILEQSLTKLITVGNAKTYEILVELILCRQYGHALDWVLPFPGDWHMLYNYMKVLTKIYWNAGLLQLGQVFGHRAETLTSLSNGTNFRRSHAFILQVMEAVYRSIIVPFLTTLSANTHSTLQTLVAKLESVDSKETLEDACSVIHVDDVFRNNLPNLELALEKNITDQQDQPLTRLMYEMAINKDCKTTITRPNPELMQRTLSILPFRSSCMKNLKQQLGINYKPTDNEGILISDTNVKKMMELINVKNLFPKGCKEPLNNLNGTVASSEQKHDLLTFRETGQSEYESFIKYRVLNTPSTTIQFRKKRLQTFSTSKQSTSKAEQLNREKRLLIFA